jgi:hypothetical protein
VTDQDGSVCVKPDATAVARQAYDRKYASHRLIFSPEHVVGRYVKVVNKCPVRISPEIDLSLYLDLDGWVIRTCDGPEKRQPGFFTGVTGLAP